MLAELDERLRMLVSVREERGRVSPQVVRGSGEGPLHVAARGPFDGGDRLPTEGIAQQVRVGVRRIAARAEVERSTERFDLCPRHVEEGPNERAVHRSDPAHPVQPPAEHETHQDGLGLVVQRVPVGHPRRADRQCDLPRLPRALESAPHLDRIRASRLVNGDRKVEGQPVPIGEPADVCGIRRRVGPQPMIHVEDGKPDPEESA